MVAALGAMVPSTHVAHAAALVCTPILPDPINSGIAATVVNDTSTQNVPVPAANFTAGTLTVGNLAGGGTVYFYGSGTVAPGTAQGTFSTMICPGLHDYYSGGTPDDLASLSFDGSITATLPNDSALGNAAGQTVTCDANSVNEVQFSVGRTGSDSLNVFCNISNTASQLKFTITLGIGGNGTGPGPATATPELDSGELLASGLVPVLGIWLYRRRRQRRQAQ